MTDFDRLLRTVNHAAAVTTRETGDMRAARRGPRPLARRLARRQFTKRVSGPLTSALFRGLFR